MNYTQVTFIIPYPVTIGKSYEIKQVEGGSAAAGIGKSDYRSMSYVACKGPADNPNPLVGTVRIDEITETPNSSNAGQSGVKIVNVKLKGSFEFNTASTDNISDEGIGDCTYRKLNCNFDYKCTISKP